MSPLYSEDHLLWKLESNGTFSTSSIHNFLCLGGIACHFASILEGLCIPHKLRCFLWLVWRKELNPMACSVKSLVSILDPMGTVGYHLKWWTIFFSTCTTFHAIWSPICMAFGFFILLATLTSFALIGCTATSTNERVEL